MFHDESSAHRRISISLFSSSKDKLLPSRIELESEESDEEGASKPTPLRFQHRVVSDSSSYSDSFSQENERTHESDDSDDLSEESELDVSEDTVEIADGQEAHPARRENGCKRWLRAMGQKLQHGLFGLWFLLKRWLRVLGHLTSRRSDGMFNRSRELYYWSGLWNRSDLLSFLHYRLSNVHQRVELFFLSYLDCCFFSAAVSY